MISGLKQTSEDLQELVDSQADFIIDCQLPSGAIPWYKGGITDPWDHIEGAIALDLCRRYQEATAAYTWSRTMQNPDGSWYSGYLDNEPQERVRDANFAAYIATGMWFHYCATQDLDFLREMWPTVEKGVDFALSLQQPTGAISWALSEKGKPWPGAILTSSCCIWHSIRNGINISQTLGINKPDWISSGERLFQATQNPDLFDKMGENERRYAMNWFYPVLTGVLTGQEAKEHIEREWSDLVIDGWGCRVAADDDVTAVAETSELIIALCLIGEQEKAAKLLDWTLRLWDDNGGFCRGIKLPEQEPCPGDDERATWTSAALIMAIAAMSKV
ncbi:MAG: prenyltransferase [Dehalococcoidia bacterium]|nr:MAG: prenyltransferase [Dehalococcoidia bacterium]